MKDNYDLYRLIKSLNTGEISFLRKTLLQDSPGKLYAKIFNEIRNIASKDAYNESAIMSRLNAGSKNSFAVAKNYLYEIILKNLSAYYSENNSDSVLRQQLVYIELLYKKTFFSKAYELLKKAKKKAYLTDNFTRLLEIIKWERNLVIEGTVKGSRPANIKRLSEEENDLLKKIRNVSEYRLLSYSLNGIMEGYTPAGRKKYLSVLKQFRKKPLLNNEKNALSVAALAAFYYTHSLISMYLGETDRVYINRKKLASLIEGRSLVLKENPLNYIISVYNLMESCYTMGYFDEMGELVEKLKHFGGVTSLTANSVLMLKYACYKEELKMLAAAGKYSETDNAMKDLLGMLENEKEKLSLYDEMEGYYIAANVYFASGKYKECALLINKILSGNFSTGPAEIIVNARILNIIIHYELKNIELVYYLIRSLYKALKQDVNGGNLNKLLIRFLGRLVKVNDDNDLTAVVGEFMSKILKEYRDKNDHITYNSLKKWMHGKTKL